MSVRDFLNNNKVSSCLVNVIKTADTNCTGVDLKGYGGVTFIVEMGNSGDTLAAGLHTQLEVEDSPDNSVWTDCADADISDSVTGANTGTFALVNAPTEDSTVFATTYRGSARYARVVINVTGTHTNGTPYSCTAIRHGKQYLPVS
jgi:hypothetical protein